MEHEFTPADDGLHPGNGDFYATETFWFSFFVPERDLGGWLYASVRPEAGVSAGGLWIWDGTGTAPWELPFYENFAWLRPPTQPSPGRIDFPTGLGVATREPLTAYDLTYTDRDRVRVSLAFDATEPPVPLRSGAPPYPRARHFDQTGRVRGSVDLDGERIEVDCHAMRDRSWGRRVERGYPRVGYSWAADAGLSLLAYSHPSGDGTSADVIHSGYLRVGDRVAHLREGTREVRRDPATGWVVAMEIDAQDATGRRVRCHGRARSRMVLPGATSVCVNTAMTWTVDGREVHGEDQDVWPLAAYRARSRGGAR